MNYLIIILAWFMAFQPSVGFSANINGELKSAQFEKLASDPTGSEARVYYNTTEKSTKIYDGTNWTSVGTGSGGGDVNLVDDPNATKGVIEWVSSGTGVTATQETTTANIPLYPNQITSTTFTNAGSGTGYSRIRKTLPISMQGAINNFTLMQSFEAGFTSGDYQLELYSNTASDYSGAYTEITMYEADSSKDIDIPAYTGTWAKHFLTQETYIEFRIVRVSGTSDLYASNIEISRGKHAKGAVVTPWEPYTPSNTQGLGTVTSGLEWRQNGENVDIQGDLTVGTVTASEIQVELPNSLTVGYKTSSVVMNAGDITRDIANPSGFDYIALATNGDSFLNIGLQIAASSTNIMTAGTGSGILANGTRISFKVSIPISEWIGKGTTDLGSNNIEYAANNGTFNATGGGTTIYGTGGSEMGVLTSWRYKDVTFQNPIQPTDRIRLEVSDDQVVWMDVTVANLAGTPVINILSTTTSAVNSSGMYWDYLSGNTIRVKWHTYQSIANDDSPVVDWSTGTFWRVVKTSSGVDVPYGLATAENPGIVKKRIRSMSKATISAAQNISNVTITKINLNTEAWDLNNDFDNSTGYDFTAPRTGYYLTHGSIGFDVNANFDANERMIMYIYKNSSQEIVVLDKMDASPATFSGTKVLSSSGVIHLTLGDTISLRAYQDTGVTTTANASGSYTFLMVTEFSTEIIVE